MKKKSVVILATVWMIALVAVASSGLTMLLTGTGISESRRNKDWNGNSELAQRYARLEEVRQTLMEEYYKEVDEETLITGAIRGMMSSLEDPYTFYYTPEEMEAENETSEGQYHGVGMLVQMTEEGGLRVVRVFRDSPAEKAGMLAGDLLIAVDGTPVSGATSKDMSEAVSMIRGEDNSAVTITIRRGTEEFDLTATRGDVTINYVEHQMLDGNVGYVQVYQFMGSVSYGFAEAVNDLMDQGVEGIIVDLRANPGGLLSAVVDMSDMVLPEGLIIYMEDRAGRRQSFYSDEQYADFPMVVLVDENSASASEIFAAAMQDYGRATIVGKTTFGKGIVQTLITFRDDGAGMQYTTASYYTPKGVSIHGEGVHPDVEVDMQESYDATITTPDPENDNQLAVAIEELQKLIEEQAEAEPAA